MNKKRTSTGEHYRISTAAALSGLPANTIRTWERRYEAVEPGRSDGGARRYDAKDVQRLVVLRRLTEKGHAIGELAGLSDDALRRRLEQTDGDTGRTVGVVNPNLAQDLQATGMPSTPVTQDALDRFRGDALIVSLADLGRTPAARAAALRDKTGATLFVLYSFATQATLDGLGRAGAWPISEPLRELYTLRRLVRLVAPTRIVQRRTAPATFDDAQLQRLRSIQSSVDCECPQQMAGLVLSLRAFEAYSFGCIENHPEDAPLHRQLAEGTQKARMQMETLLQALCEAEGLF